MPNAQQTQFERLFVEDRKIKRVRFLIHSSVGGFEGMLNRLRRGKPCKVWLAKGEDPEELLIVVEEVEEKNED